MTMKPFAHANASSPQEAAAALSDTCRPLAGGTDLLSLMKADLAAPERLVNLKTIPGLNQITFGAEGWHLGATATLAQLAANDAINTHPKIACFYEALVQSASPQLRHMATLGGNLLQKPRCWYYRNPLTHCWRKGGQMCYAFRGENKYHVLLGGGPCYAVHPSDPAVALLALDAAVVLVGPQGERTLPLTEFYRKPSRENRSDNVLAVNELVTAVTIPTPPEGTRGTYVKVAERATWDFALTGVAAQLTFAEGTVQRARGAFGGVATIPWRAPAVEAALTGQRLTEETIEQAAQAAVEGVRPLEDNGYKVDLLQGVVREALHKLASC